MCIRDSIIAARPLKIGGSRFGPIADAELLVDVLQMKLDRVFAQHQAVGNLRIGHALGNQGENFVLAF